MGISQQIGASSMVKWGVCTSSTRPASPYHGQHIYETDTNLQFVWNGSAWVNNYASSASPTFTGTVTIPAGASISGFAPLASPALTGTPTAPTATAGTNTTQIATMASRPWNVPWGVVGYAQKLTVATVDTNRFDLTSITFTGVSGRLYKATTGFYVYKQTSAGYISGMIVDGSNTTRQETAVTLQVSEYGAISLLYYFTQVGTLTLKSAAYAQNATNNYVFGNTQYPHQFIIEDVGPA